MAEPATGPAPRSQTEPGPRPQTFARRHRGWLVTGVVAGVLLVVVIAAWYWVLRTPLGVLAQAAVATAAQETAATRISATAGGLPIVGDIDVVVADGSVDFSAGTARFQRELLGGVATEIRYTTEGTYLQLPLAPDRWVALGGAGDDPDAAPTPGTGETDGSPTDLTQIAPGVGNPVALVGLLRALEEAPQEAGTEQVTLGETPDGPEVTVTRYRAVIDLEAAADVTGDGAGVADLRRLTGSDRLPVTVGVDGDGLIRAVRFDGTVPLAGPLEAQWETEITFIEFGVVVAVEPPPPGQVVDLDPSRLAELDPLGALRDLLATVPGG